MEQQIRKKIEGILRAFDYDCMEEYRTKRKSDTDRLNALERICAKHTDQLLTLIANHDTEMLAKIEGKKRNCPHDSRSHCLEENCYIWEENGYNQAIDDIKSLYGEENKDGE